MSQTRTQSEERRLDTRVDWPLSPWNNPIWPVNSDWVRVWVCRQREPALLLPNDIGAEILNWKIVFGTPNQPSIISSQLFSKYKNLTENKRKFHNSRETPVSLFRLSIERTKTSRSFKLRMPQRSRTLGTKNSAVGCKNLAVHQETSPRWYSLFLRSLPCYKCEKKIEIEQSYNAVRKYNFIVIKPRVKLRKRLCHKTTDT